MIVPSVEFTETIFVNFPLVSKDFTFKVTTATRSWSPVKVWEKIPPPRHSHSAVVYKDCMYIFGGISNGGNHLKDVHAFDFSTCYSIHFKLF